jgi:hypothetical protein
MATGSLNRSDLPKLHGIVQNSMITYPKEIVIDTLRNFFSQDSYYHYVKDVWGFPNTTDNTDLPLEAGLNDNSSTRLFIGENYRFDGIFYPAILVKHGGARYVPVSINRETGKVQWGFRTFEDGYGNFESLAYPQAFVFNGAWEGSLVIDIMTRSLTSRDQLLELVGIALVQLSFESLRKAGVVVKPPQISAPSEIDDRNDKLFRQTITIDIRTEWEVQKPIGSVLEVINFALEFGRVDVPDAPAAANLTINTDMTILDIMSSI